MDCVINNSNFKISNYRELIMLSNLFITFWAFMLMGIPVLAAVCSTWGLCKACNDTENNINQYGLVK